MTAFGVYPLAAEVDDNTGVTLDIDHSFLPFWPGRSALAGPLQITWVWPVIDSPHQAACRALLNNSLAASVAPGGRLAGLLTAGMTPRPAAQTSPGSSRPWFTCSSPRDSLPKAKPMRSIEYDTVSDRYDHFLLEEVLPEVEKVYKLRPDGYSRGIAGESSGGICSLNSAWFMPEKFSRVHSAIGSYTSIQWRPEEKQDGGNLYPFMVRKLPKRNIRVWMSDGIRRSRKHPRLMAACRTFSWRTRSRCGSTIFTSASG